MRKNDHAPVLETHAVLIKKTEIPYVDLATGKGIPIQKPIFDLHFQTASNEVVVFSVSELEYFAVDLHEEGKLLYKQHKHYNEIIAFADKIHDFKME